jgi:hypothetical protein
MTRFIRINTAHLSPSLASQLLQGDGDFQTLRSLLILPLLCFALASDLLPLSQRPNAGVA